MGSAGRGLCGGAAIEIVTPLRTSRILHSDARAYAWVWLAGRTIKLAQLLRARTDLFTIQKDAANPAYLRVVRLDKPPPHHRFRDGRALLEAAWQRAPKQNGWVFTGSLGQHVKKIDPAFEPKAYGYTRLTQLLQAYPDRFELRQRSKGQYDVRLIGVSGNP